MGRRDPHAALAFRLLCCSALSSGCSACSFRPLRCSGCPAGLPRGQNARPDAPRKRPNASGAATPGAIS
eukprot:8832587-Lingulodinium_polyedra.AAC.1